MLDAGNLNSTGTWIAGEPEGYGIIRNLVSPGDSSLPRNHLTFQQSVM